MKRIKAIISYRKPTTSKLERRENFNSTKVQFDELPNTCIENSILMLNDYIVYIPSNI